MSGWILQHFLNPSFFWAGVALVSVPIIVHLIHRLRYKRVRFAAMEFLLASQKRNRRRIFFEQLLLLLMRCAMILLLLALLGRLILDPDQLSLFQGAQSHHVIVLDDSASMRDRDGEGTVFDAAKEVIRNMVAEGARRPGSQKFTLIRMSNPTEAVSGLSQRDVDETLLTELTQRLDVMTCTHQAADPAAALEAALQRLQEDRAVTKHVHVLSDLRKPDWIDNKAAVAALKQLDAGEVNINLVRCVGDAHENLAVTSLDGSLEVAAAGVPVTLRATVENYGSREAKDVSGSIFIDGERLPRTIDFQTVGAGESVTRSFDVIFDSAEQHQVSVSIAEDSLEADNRRFLAVDVPVANPVLLIDGSPATEQALYVADALAADQSVTGFAPSIRTPEDLRQMALEKFHLIYLINVPELAPDAVAALGEYVQNGGGLIWYLGDAVRPAFYNESLFDAEAGLFPVRLGLAPAELERIESPVPDLTLADRPMFSLFTDAEVPILDLVYINLYFPIETSNTDTMVKDAATLGSLRNGSLLMLEHDFGKGKVFTCLTTAGPLMNLEGVTWNNWANGPASFSFAVFQLELAKNYVRKDRTRPQQLAGEPLQVRLNSAYYQPDVDVVTPDDQVNRIQASAPDESDDDTNDDEPATQFLASFRETDEPGIYTFTLTNQQQELENQLFAVNVPAQEGALQVMQDNELLRTLGEDVSVEIASASDTSWIRSESPGSEVRWFLLVMLAVIGMGEQLLASRLSYVSS